jgi:hypothetical protein
MRCPQCEKATCSGRSGRRLRDCCTADLDSIRGDAVPAGTGSCCGRGKSRRASLRRSGWAEACWRRNRKVLSGGNSCERGSDGYGDTVLVVGGDNGRSAVNSDSTKIAAALT